MPHSLILGMTESGKTTCAKQLAGAYRAQKIPVIVLDPMNDPEWQADFQTTRPDEFLEVFWKSKKCAVFIDEAGQAVGRYDTVMQQTATKGRHWGHNVHFLSQRGAQIAVTVRDQCSHLFLFTSSKKDSVIHANEWNKDQLMEASQLPKGAYFHVTRFGTCERGHLWDQSNEHSESDISDDSDAGESAGRAAEKPANRSGADPGTGKAGSDPAADRARRSPAARRPPGRPARVSQAPIKLNVTESEK